jgi:hypothetical protein
MAIVERPDTISPELIRHEDDEVHEVLLAKWLRVLRVLRGSRLWV